MHIDFYEFIGADKNWHDGRRIFITYLLDYYNKKVKEEMEQEKENSKFDKVYYSNDNFAGEL